LLKARETRVNGLLLPSSLSCPLSLPLVPLGQRDGVLVEVFQSMLLLSDSGDNWEVEKDAPVDDEDPGRSDFRKKDRGVLLDEEREGEF